MTLTHEALSTPALVRQPTGCDPREINSDELLGGARLVVIRHGQTSYRLQRTAAGKLILTK